MIFNYEGQSINSDNGSVSQTIILESELFVKQNVDMGIACSCQFDALRIYVQHGEFSWPRKSRF